MPKIKNICRTKALSLNGQPFGLGKVKEVSLDRLKEPLLVKWLQEGWIQVIDEPLPPPQQVEPVSEVEVSVPKKAVKKPKKPKPEDAATADSKPEEGNEPEGGLDEKPPA